MGRPLISFVIPFYNRFNLLKEAIQSIFDSPFKDVEIVLIDDASNADGLDDLFEYIKHFKNITYIKQSENSGPGAARNRGLKVANGKWVFFMDSDDVIYGDRLPELCEFLTDKTQQNMDFVIVNKCRYRFLDGHIENIQHGNGTIDEYINSFFYIVHIRIGQLWNFIFRRIFLIENSIESLHIYLGEDRCFFLSAYCHAKNISIYSRYFYEYRVGSDFSLAWLGNDFVKNFDKIRNSRRLFFRHLITLYESDIQNDKKNHIEHLLHTFILLSQWDADEYRKNKNICNILNKLRNNLINYTNNWSKKIYISPCFFEAQFVARLVTDWGGGGDNGGDRCE
jgi:glycosyltransferase involved in cell wall biosynthesis